MKIPLLCRLGWHRWDEVFTSPQELSRAILGKPHKAAFRVCTRCGKRRN